MFKAAMPSPLGEVWHLHIRAVHMGWCVGFVNEGVCVTKPLPLANVHTSAPALEWVGEPILLGSQSVGSCTKVPGTL